MASDVSGAAPASLEPAGSHQTSVAALEAAIQSLGLEFNATVAQIADSLTALSRPSPLGTAKRDLILQWIGAVGDEFQWEAELSDRNLMTVLIRAISIEHATVLQADDVARRRGSTLRELRADMVSRQLWGFERAGALLFPSWQFIDAGARTLELISEVLPTVLQCIPPDAPPALVTRLMCSEDPHLQRGGSRCSPREHLIAGGSPWPVVRTLLLVLEGSASRLPDLVLGGRDDR